MKCHKCGTEIADGDLFCKNCGSKTERHAMFCRECGSKMDIESKFCSNCGAKNATQDILAELPQEKLCAKEGTAVESIVEDDYVSGTDMPAKQRESFGVKSKKKISLLWGKLSIYGKFAAIITTVLVLMCLVAFLASKPLAGVIALIALASVVVSLLMKKQIIKVAKNWVHILVLVVAIIMVVPYFAAFGVKSNDSDAFQWSDILLSDELPEPPSTAGEIKSNKDNHLSLYVHQIAPSDYNTYVSDCKAIGFTIDAEESTYSYNAYSDSGFKLSLYFYENKEKIHIELSATEEYGTLQWPVGEETNDLPMPDSTTGKITRNSESGFSAYVADTTIDDYKEYVLACVAKGFSVDANITEKHFSAQNTDGYMLSVNYEGNNVIYISLDKPEITDSNDPNVEPETTDNFISDSDLKFNVTIEVECVENWVFSKYDVDVYIDDHFEGTIAHGNTKSFELTLTEGSYILRFVNSEDNDVDGEVEFHIQKDERLKYTISCTSSHIDVDTIAGSSANNDGEKRVEKDGFDSTTNDVYTIAGYTVEIPSYWISERNVSGGIQRYAETGGKVAMLQISAQAEDDDNYPVTFEGLMDDNDNMIEVLERTAFEEITDYEIIDTGIVKGILYKGNIIEEETGLKGYAEWFTFPSEEDRTWCTMIICQTDNTDCDYTADFRKMIESIGINEDLPTEITLTMGEEDFKGMNYQEAEKLFREMGFTTFEYETVETEIEYANDTICYIEITELIFGDSDFAKGDKYDAGSTITFYTYEYEAPSPVYYSTNDYETAKKGNTGVFSYVADFKYYDVYWIIDFDEGYVYYFLEGEGNTTCDRLKIESGTLNDAIIITYHDGGYTWSYKLHFEYVGHPETLIMVDNDGFVNEYAPVDLDYALLLRDTKTINDY